jgi:hypothetical protein
VYRASHFEQIEDRPEAFSYIYKSHRPDRVRGIYGIVPPSPSASVSKGRATQDGCSGAVNTN